MVQIEVKKSEMKMCPEGITESDWNVLAKNIIQDMVYIWYAKACDTGEEKLWRKEAVMSNEIKTFFLKGKQHVG